MPKNPEFSSPAAEFLKQGILEQGRINGALFATIDWLKTPDYGEKLRSKNLPSKMIQETLADIHSLDSIELLTRRAREILVKASNSLTAFYQEKGDIVIPFSGGRDSTAIAFLTASLFPDRTIWLVTALNGFEDNPANARQQADSICTKLAVKGNNIIHIYADFSDGYDQYVIAAAWQDRGSLQHPAICSGCKILMEDRLAKIAESLGAKHLAFGYVFWQARQQWAEQDERQMALVRSYQEERYPDLHVGAPFFQIINKPYDSALLLGILGFQPKEQKDEIGCVARGLNPQQLNGVDLPDFVAKKITDLPSDSFFTVGLESPPRPAQSPRYAGEVDKLKGNPHFMEGVFIQ